VTVRPATGLVSVVVPCFNEEDVIQTTHEHLLIALASIAPLRVEIIYVDDGSTDGTWAKLTRIQVGDSRVRVVRLARNFGHQIALSAGVDYASGDAVVTIDADLQDPPEVIPELVTEWLNGGDVVYAVRADRAAETAFKRGTAKVYYRLLNRLADTDVPVDTGDFRLLDRRAADALRSMPEHDRYVRGMVAWIGFDQRAIPYNRAPRAAGETKYPFVKMLRFAADGVISFSFAPLRLATWLGFVASALALVGASYSIVVWLLGDTVPGWTTLSVAVLLLGGIQLVSLGIMGEYVGRIYREVKRRPLYLVAERTGFDVGTEDGGSASSGP
jgi:glycosyltransferase involved in cell wall biosynthesis